jgi:tetratricopeptide (TPR) repeat protein/predicted Ser/Thr protein kinase
MSTQFGKYTIEKKLGEGGMGAVYLAVDQGLGRKVALKVITSKDDELLERFQREAQAVARLKHPNIVQVYESGAINKQHYFTMDYVEGVSLEKFISSAKKPSIQNIAKVLLQIAAALQYAHSQELVHRDIKPANILIDKTGKAFLTDFGVAKSLSGLDRTLTLAGSTVGTPGYMSPEQAMGLKDQIDHRSDIFSLGATLYHCLTGVMPFDGKEIYDVLSKVINKDPPAPSTVVKMVPRDLETICLKCMEKDKSKRYQTTAELAADIKKYLQDEPISARRTSTVSKLWVKARKNKTISISVAGSAVILSAVIIGLIISSARTSGRLEQFRQEAYQAFEAKKYDEARIACEKIKEIGRLDDKLNSIYEQSLAAIKEKEQTALGKEVQAKKRAEAKVALDRAERTPHPDKRIEIAQEALKIDPTFAEAYQMMGEAYRDKREYDKAVEFFSKAIDIAPTLAYAYYERAVIKASICNQPDAAIPDFEKVLQYDPESHIGWFAKGSIEGEKKQYDAAIQNYTKAIKLYPQYDWAYNNRGLIYCKSGDTDRALADYNQALRLNPALPAAYINRGVVYRDRSKRGTSPDECRKLIDRAIADYNEALRLNPQSPEAYTNRGLAYKDKAEYEINPDARKVLLERAMADYNEAIRANHKWVPAYNNRGTLYKDMGEADRAIADLNEAIRLDPKMADAYNNRGLAYNIKAKRERSELGGTDGEKEFEELMDQAIADYNKAIDLNPKDVKAYNNRGNAYQDRKELNRAIADFNEAIRLAPTTAAPYVNRGNAYVKMVERAERERSPDDFGKRNPAEWRELIDRAIADFNEALRLEPLLSAAYYNRANAYYKSGKWDKAVADYAQVISLYPNDAEAYYYRGLACEKSGDSDRAIADYNEAIRLNPKYADAYNSRGLVYYNRGELDEAIADYSRAIELTPKSAMCYANRGEVYANTSELDKAISDCNEAVKLDSEYASAYSYRGYAYAKKAESAKSGKSPDVISGELMDKAIADCNKALNLNPESVDGYLYRAKVSALNNDYKQAVADAEQFLKLTPNHPNAPQMRGLIEEWKKKEK